MTKYIHVQPIWDYLQLFPLFMQQSLWFNQLKHWLTFHIGETTPFTAGCQSLVFPSACFGEESFRSLNPNFSRGSLVMSWL